MKPKTASQVLASGGLAALGTILLAVPATARSLTEFDAPENEKLGWRVVDDGVMGGRSQGNAAFADSGILRFSGELSLENNGGFSSMRTGDIDLDLSGSDGLAVRVKGDGRTYQLRLGSDARYRGMEVSFMADFPTEKDKWTEVQVPFTDFTGSFRGRTLKNEVLNTAKIQRIGLLLADKKAGPFKLEVDWIRAYGGGSKGGTVVDQAVADGRFKTLAAALTEAGLVELLQGEGPFTVFAPTDSAFAKLPEGTVESLLKPENRDQLQAILKYHVSPGATRLAGALDAGSAATAQGESLEIAFRKGQVRVNDAAILDADLEGSNGVIHVIDAVLLPSKSGGSKCGGTEAAVEPMELIQDAIERGVPIFNHGDHKQCAEIYRACLETLSGDQQVDAEMREALKKVLEHADGEHVTDRKRAWIYRGALDSVYRVMMR